MKTIIILIGLFTSISISAQKNWYSQYDKTDTTYFNSIIYKDSLNYVKHGVVRYIQSGRGADCMAGFYDTIYWGRYYIKKENEWIEVKKDKLLLNLDYMYY